MTEATNSAVPGFYGKVPTHGDFVHRRLPRSFLDPWDQWLQRAVAFSKAQLAGDWLDTYLTSPIWRFALSSGLCGERATAGLLMPSVDSVGRYYPLLIAAFQPNKRNLFELAAVGEQWFTSAEEIALYCLEETFAIDQFEEQLRSLGPLSAGSEEGRSGPPALRSLSTNQGLGWRIHGDAFTHLASQVYPELLDEIFRPEFSPYSLWWSIGSERVAPSFVVYRGLPPSEDFSTFLTGPGAVEEAP